jgi:UDP-glucuronate 4-epimerase
MSVSINKKVALITGSAGFIGFHICKKLLDEGYRVIGLDSLSDYYDVTLKKNREKILSKSSNFKYFHLKLENVGVLLELFCNEKPEIVIHLAGQAGVRSSIEAPRTYLESNIIGTFEVLEASRAYPPKHLLLASTSSAYGANKKMPYSENDKSDHPMSFYAATKKSMEGMAHSYSHLFNIPTTIFRFFTVYGPWGRPDMGYFKFTKAIINEEKIDIYNYGNMQRDFTYIDDLIEGIRYLIECIPNKNEVLTNHEIDSLSPVAPFRLVNIGNSNPINLMDFVRAIENAIGKKAKTNLIPMQPGDVVSTWADNKLIKSMTKYQGNTNINEGMRKFVKWYRDYYNV